MANDTLTLKLQGEVSLADFAKAIARFDSLVRALTENVASGSIEWAVDDLQPGSATTTTLGTAQTLEPLLRVRRAYLLVGQALDAGDHVAYPPAVPDPTAGILA